MPRLPLFPLPLVLLPGVTLPLHIFEPRYRQMLDDCIGDTALFGVAWQGDPDGDIASLVGTVGCTARIMRRETLADGRSNVVVEGTERFLVRRIVTSNRSYHVGEVDRYDDLVDTAESAAELAQVEERVRPLFLRVAAAARAIANERHATPALPGDAARLSFAIAGMVDLDLAARQRMLVSRSPAGRLRDLERLLEPVAPVIESRAEVHRRAGGNGHGPQPEP